MIDYSTKTIEKVYSYSNVNDETRRGSQLQLINGRRYLKFGLYQTVTLVGVLYKVYDPSVKLFKHVLHVGVSKQHPSDIVVSKQLGMEIAHENALINPVCIMEVGSNWHRYHFVEFAKLYIDGLDLQFVKTSEELNNQQ